jgi:hypothetical protein
MRERQIRFTFETPKLRLRLVPVRVKAPAVTPL